MEISQLDGLLGGFTLVHVKIHSYRRKRKSQKHTLLKSKKGEKSSSKTSHQVPHSCLEFCRSFWSAWTKISLEKWKPWFPILCHILWVSWSHDAVQHWSQCSSYVTCGTFVPRGSGCLNLIIHHQALIVFLTFKEGKTHTNHPPSASRSRPPRTCSPS